MKKEQAFLKQFKYSLDALVLLASYFIAILTFNEGRWPGFSILFYTTATVIWFSVSVFSKLYAERRSNKYSEEMVQIFYHMLLFSVSLSSLLFFLNLNQKYSSQFIIFFIVLVALFTIASKYLIRKKVHSSLYKGNFYDSVLLIGSTAAAENFIDTVNKYYYYGYKCVGYIDDANILNNTIVNTTANNELNSIPYFGNIETLESVLQQSEIDEVFIALPQSETAKIQHCIETCDRLKVRVRMLPDLTDLTASSIYINNIGQLPVVNVGYLPLDRKENKLAKRIFDIIFSSVFFLTLGIVLFPLIALIIKLTSKGPIIFSQERWGHNNIKITCYKFRSMIKESSDLDHNGNYNQAQKDDPRVTWIGRILRKTNLDELPQFWNVLLGNMSVVGPRPHPTPLNLESMQTVDNYMLRHLVVPGITGLAQVNGCRGETRTKEEMQRRVNFDLYYIHRWNFWLDMQIIIQTVVNIFRGDQNAY